MTTFDTTSSSTLTTTSGVSDVTATGVSVGYVSPDWNTYVPAQNCYPYNPWGVYPYYQPWINPWPYIPPTQYVTQQIVIPRGLTDEEIDRIADKVAEKLRAERKPRR